MAIQVEDLLTLAEQLATQDGEAAHRSAVSRAYYFAYHVSKTWHAQLPAPGSNAGPAGGVHQQVINQLRNPAPELSQEQKNTSRKHAVLLEVLRGARHLADYNLAGPMSATDAAQACANAKRFSQLQ